MDFSVWLCLLVSTMCFQGQDNNIDNKMALKILAGVNVTYSRGSRTIYHALGDT